MIFERRTHLLSAAFAIAGIAFGRWAWMRYKIALKTPAAYQGLMMAQSLLLAFFALLFVGVAIAIVLIT